MAEDLNKKQQELNEEQLDQVNGGMVDTDEPEIIISQEPYSKPK